MSGTTTIPRLLPDDEAYALLELTADIADRELAPRASAFEERGDFPRDLMRTLGRAGLLGLPYPVEFGGGGQPYEVFVQVVEELARRWLTVAEAVSVHTLACYPIAAHGTDAQRERWLPDLIGGELLGAYCLSEPQGGSDPAAMTTRAAREGDELLLRGTKAWI
ncbi:MAG TPA: acyl-CoA dehydrogenase family protein, partial [Rugosimonospora sp.]|nr:acyl-CoA dehydrogenase family protein [Rugosimonospora sp.]